MKLMWTTQMLLAVIGISAGIAVAGGLFAFLVELGVVADFADRTHTGDRILLYESCAAFGGIIGNIIYVFQISIPAGPWILGICGILAGIFAGCWAMALAEILNVFPVFLRRAGLIKYLTVFILSIALGKGLGACLFFFRGW